MLKFWKKPGTKEKESASKPVSPSISPHKTSNQTPHGVTNQNCTNVDEILNIIENCGDVLEKSRLSKTLDEVLKDSEALSYFIQYLEAVQNGALIKFMLDVISFKSSIHETNHLFGNNSNSVNNSVFCDIHAYDDEKWITDLLESQSLNHVKDAVKIYQKYFSNNADYKIVIEKEVKLRICNKLCVPGLITEDVFDEVENLIYQTLQNEHFNNFLSSEYHCKYQIDILTSSKVLISDILYNETALFYFMEYLEQENCRCLLEFWMAANNFSIQYKDNNEFSSIQIQEDAMVLYDKYFSLQATSPLNLGDRVRLEVEENICREGGPLPTCFTKTKKLIVKILEVKHLESFLTSQLYLKYLSELITTIQASPVLCPVRSSGGSDCGSDVSISTTNTLLVSADAHPPSRTYWSQTAIGIDTRQLYEPDLLWQRGRTKRKNLCFGRVNALGRFESDMEPEPDKKEGFRLTKAVKKLVNLEEDKNKEEMAWKVAAMIVKDVTSLTLNHSSNE